ncbi:MAG TPA: GDSL-type esterase/lipase family protein, partial [Blastocatellia bacterium]|nr:GDSL-type esterase/lipase family protein [Blastocatellia bacterium]
ELLPRTLPRITGLRDDAPVMSRTVQQSLLAIAFVAATLVVARAAPRPHEPARLVPAIEDTAGAMATFYGALSRAARGEATARVLHYGDSHVAADLLTGALRRDLQGCFGDAGAGFVLAGKPYSYYARPGVTIRASGGWRVNGLSDAALVDDGRFGLAGISFTAADVGESFRVTAPSRRFELYLLKQPGGGAVTIFLDGVIRCRDLPLAAAHSEAAYVEMIADTEAIHTIEVTVTRAGAVRVLGVDIERDAAGVIYDALGINGARMTRLLQWDWRVLSSNLKRSDPDLIVIAYGSNEVGDADLNLDEYRERFFTLLAQLREAAPRASLLVVAPPDRAIKTGDGWQTINRMPALVAAQRQATVKAGAAFFDLFHAMGGAGSITRWASLRPALAQPDRVHLTLAGYRLVADWLYAALMRDWLASMGSEPGRLDR